MRVPVYSLLPTATTPIRALSPHSNRVEAYHNGGSWDRSVRHFFRGNVYGIATETTATFNGITGFYALGGSFIGGAAWEIFNSTARHNNPSDPYSFITDDIHAGAGSVIYVGHSMVGNWNEDTGALLGSFGDNDTF